MNENQLAALKQLDAALQLATSSGLFDVMGPAVSHPDLINKFCDDVDAMKAFASRNDELPMGAS